MTHRRELLVAAWRHRPSDVTLCLTSIPLGLTAMIVGPDVSQALTNVTAPIVSRAMGAALFLGGVLTIVGYLRENTTAEALGLTLLALGTGVYGVGVAIGLGMKGIMAAGLSLTITVSKLRRLQVLIELVDKPPPLRT